MVRERFASGEDVVGDIETLIYDCISRPPDKDETSFNRSVELLFLVDLYMTVVRKRRIGGDLDLCLGAFSVIMHDTFEDHHLHSVYRLLDLKLVSRRLVNHLREFGRYEGAVMIEELIRSLDNDLNLWRTIGKSFLDGYVCRDCNHPRFRPQLLPGLQRLCCDNRDTADPNECVIQVRVCGYNLSHMFECTSPSERSDPSAMLKYSDMIDNFRSDPSAMLKYSDMIDNFDQWFESYA